MVWHVVLIGLLAVGTVRGALVREEGMVQSKARPYGLDIVGPVQAGGTDEASAVFRERVLPDLSKFVNATLAERAGAGDGLTALDPTKLKLTTTAEVRVYFVSEGAAYQNSLGFSTGGGIKGEDAKLIFPNASSNISPLSSGASGKPVRTSSEPLLPGDFVDLGKFAAGTMLDFFLIADGARTAGPVYVADPAANPDRTNHVVSFVYALADSPLLIIGFEDMFGGGDRDFNDLVFAVDLGMANLAALTAAPEPSLAMGGAVLALVAFGRRRRPAVGASCVAAGV